MLIFQGGWSDYEEHDYIKIYENDGRYYLHRNCHNVMCDGPDKRPRQEITHDEALELMLEFADCED